MLCIIFISVRVFRKSLGRACVIIIQYFRARVIFIIIAVARFWYRTNNDDNRDTIMLQLCLVAAVQR